MQRQINICINIHINNNIIKIKITPVIQNPKLIININGISETIEFIKQNTKHGITIKHKPINNIIVMNAKAIHTGLANKLIDKL